MVTEVEIRGKIEAKPITLQELGEIAGLPIVVSPWWGSRRRRVVEARILIRIEGSHVEALEPLEDVPKRVRWIWECPAQEGNQKKRPEIHDGKIHLWEGPCGYQGHTHAQTIKILDIRARAMLISLGLTGIPDTHFLLGMDEGHPFATQVIRKPQTVKEAFDWLMPNMVKRAIDQGLCVKRQGDWFFIPTNKEPRLDSDGQRFFPAGTPMKANTPYRRAPLIYNCAQTRHRGSLVVYQSVLGLPCVAPFVKENVRAPNHNTLRLRGWHIGVRRRSHPWSNTGPRQDD